MDLGQLQVLIVDDFNMIRFMLKKNLTDLGIANVTEAKHGKEAKELIEAKLAQGSKFDMIFSDWNMPEMDGHELLVFCKSHATMKAVPFVLVTAEGEATTIKKALQDGANDFIVKPFSPEVLSRKIEKLLASMGK